MSQKLTCTILMVFQLAVVAGLLFIGCNSTTPIEAAPEIQHIRLIESTYLFALYEVDGCRYLVAKHAILHEANCPNHGGGK